MKLSDVTAWLASSQDFAQGAALYAALGRSRAYQRLFALPATESSQGVLLRELRALVPQLESDVGARPPELPPELPPVPVAPLPAPEATLPAPVATLPVPAPEAPLVVPAPARPATTQLLEELAQQLQLLRDERSHLHPQLTGQNVGRKARGVTALRIVAITAEIGQVKALQAHVQQHGRLPGPVATDEVSDEGELRRRLQNCRSQRSKLKKQPTRAADLALVEAEILLILSKLTP